MRAAIVIPARYGSTRLPGKPLAKILGKSLLHRTWMIARAVSGIDEVFVATDDERIYAHTHAFGGKAIMTPPECGNGTERVLAALKAESLKPDFVINLQGDAVLTPPSVIQPVVDALSSDRSIDVATPATHMSLSAYEELCKQKQAGIAGGTLVTFDKNGRALYFSKSLIPFIRKPEQYLKQPETLPVYRHIGLYGFRYDMLEKYVELPATPLEQSEGLEQLRALEHGMNVRVVQVSYGGRTHWSVDSPEDIKVVEAIIEREGELVDMKEEQSCPT